MKVQTLMLAINVVVECPNCGSFEEGFVGNPAGGEFVCDNCKEPYRVHPEADIEHR